MATTDTDVSQLVINKLTKAQYDGITTPSDTELYFVDDGKTYATTDMLATVATSGSYTDLTNKPTIPAAQVNSDWDANSGVAKILNKPSLATVATSGLYSDLTGTPALATVATTGAYSDLTGTPTIPTVNNATLTIQRNSTNVATFTANASSNVTANISVPTATSDLNNDSGFLTSSTLPVATTSSLGVVQVGSGLTVSSGGVLSATGGGVADSVAWGHITGTMADQTDLTNALAAKVDSSSLATVATSGSYNDLLDTPTIPAAQIQSDWTQADNTKLDYIKNKPSIPTVNDATLTITQNGTSAGTFTANASSNKTIALTDTTYSDATTSASGLMSSTDKTKLNSIATGAEVNVQANWTEADSSSDAYILNKPSLATVATSGAYSDLSGTPSLATVATSGSYNDLSNKPSIPAAQVQSDWTQATATAVDYIKNKPSLATVATSGSYNDLSNKPTIPAAQVNSDWDAASGVAQILNKPSLAAVATSGSYTDLSDLPTIPTVNNATLTIQKNGTTVNTFTANASSNKTANITVPTTVAELSDASDYATTSALAGKQNTLTAGDHISISSDTISAVDYVHSESPVTLSSPTPVVTGSMIANGTITASNIAAGEMVTLTLSTTDIGEGAALAANTLYGVYQ